jgi:glycosyltransferase involved in cell wall biosynthesis
MTSGDNTQIFNYAKNVYGGTEYMAETFHERVLPKLSNIQNYNCLIMPGMVLALTKYLENDKGFIVWLHNTLSQFNQEVMFMFKNPIFLERLKYIVVPSEAHKQEVNREAQIPLDKIYVIPNAIYPVDSDLERFKGPKQIKLINTSAFDRSAPLLLDTIDSLSDDIRVDIFNDFYPELFENLPPLDSRVFFYGRTPKKTVLDAVSKAHIFAYPSIFFETFCLSLAEAMSAGLLPIYPDYGSLKEISGGRGIMYQAPTDLVEHIGLFKEKLQEGIELINSGNWDPTEQIEYINNKFSWDVITQHWIELDNKL